MTRERLSNIDTVMLRVEDSVQPNVGAGVMLLGAPVDVEWLKATIEARLLRFDRFRQRVVPSRLPWRQPYWEEDPDVDLNYHLQLAVLPPPGDKAALQELVSLLASMPLDLDRPLWQVHLVKSYGKGSAIICRVHHSLADGVALMQVLLSLADSDPEALPPLRNPEPRQNTNPGPQRTGLIIGRRAAMGLAKRGLRRLTNPPRATELARLARQASTAVGALLLYPPDSDTVLRGKRSVPKRAAWSVPIPLDDIKTIGRRLDGTVNDVLLAAMTGAVGRYLQDQGEPLSNVEVSALVPVSLRPEGTEEELGNRIGIFFVPLPVDVLDPVDRLHELKRRMDEHKHSLEAPVVFAAMQAFGGAPSGVIKPAVDYLCTRATTVVTNVKGPQERLYLAGAPLEAFMFWIPRFGGIGLGISIMSYAGEVRVGVISDKDTVSNPESIIAAFHDEFDALRTRALEVPPSVQALSARLDDALTALDGILSDETG
jgi:WS/DGAT/MGAT family acyltransferase